MKKFVLLMLALALILAGISIGFFLFFYSDKSNQQIVDISKTVFQAMLTGTVTFCGLFLTIWSQEYQNNKSKRFEQCPCIIIEHFNGLSAVRDVTTINDSEEVIICCSKSKIRVIDLSICNCKSNYGLNIYIKSKTEDFLLGNIKDKNKKLRVALNTNDDKLIFKFEDIYGLKYEQKIYYKYNNNAKSIAFISCQPKRRKS